MDPAVAEKAYNDILRSITCTCVTCAKTVTITENGWRCFYCGNIFCVRCGKKHFAKGPDK